ncbi:MAG: MBL fold metallo-hydrolase [Lachnospiraceae bacterium]|nr:MBL fold metallo-hydrolase [Lachnospiraceae bacterium]
MAKLKIGRIMLGMCQTNCYFLYREGETKVIFIDPADQGKYIYDKLAEKGFSVEAILLTHGHFDHILGAKALRELSGAKIYATEADKVLLQDPYVNVSAQWAKPYTMEADEYIRDGQVLTFGDISCKVLVTPGHTIGSCCFYFEEDGILISGDTLFQESVGRTDLPTGSMSKLVRSLQEKLFVLPEETAVYPGHGNPTSIGYEKKYNPYA